MMRLLARDRSRRPVILTSGCSTPRNQCPAVNTKPSPVIALTTAGTDANNAASEP